MVIVTNILLINYCSNLEVAIKATT